MQENHKNFVVRWARDREADARFVCDIVGVVEGNTLQLGFGMFQPCVGEPPEEFERVYPGQAVFRRCIRNRESLAVLLEELCDGGQLHTRFGPIDFGKGLSLDDCVEKRAATEVAAWPTAVRSLRCGERTGRHLPKLLVAYGLPIFESVREAIEFNYFGGRSPMIGTDSTGVLYLVEPDERGRLVEARQQGEGLLVKYELPREVGDGVEIVARVDYPSKSYQSYHVGVSASGETLMPSVKPGWRKIRVCLVFRGSDKPVDEVVAFWPPSLVSPESRVTVDENCVSGEVDALAVSQGENAVLEFKPAVPMCEDQKELFGGKWEMNPLKAKRQEVLRVIFSFANTQGGTVILGLSDDGTPDENTMFQQCASDEMDDRVEQYRRSVQDHYAKLLPAEIAIRTSVQRVGTLPVICVATDKAEHPVAGPGMKPPEYLIRVNATTRQAKEHEVQRIFREALSSG